MLHVQSLVNGGSGENERGNKDGSPEEDARGEKRRVIPPLPVISDICISLSLTVLRRSDGGSDLHANGPTLSAAKMTAFS